MQQSNYPPSSAPPPAYSAAAPYPPAHSAAAPYPPAPPAAKYNQPPGNAPQYGQSYGYPASPQHDPEAARTTSTSTQNDWASPSFNDKSIRLRFIRKVYMILTCQLAVTVAFICFFIFHQPTRNWVRGSGSWFYFVSYVVFLVTYIILVCCPTVRRKWPANFICLSIFTLAFSYMTATISSYHDIEAVLYAAGITTIVCVGISIFACQTKFDFTKCGGLLFVLLLVLILFGFGCMIAYFISPVDRRTHAILQCVYGSLGALVFALFLAYDTQMLLGGRKHELSEEEHVFAALQLYLDVVYIFLFILMIFGGGKN